MEYHEFFDSLTRKLRETLKGKCSWDRGARIQDSQCYDEQGHYFERVVTVTRYHLKTDRPLSVMVTASYGDSRVAMFVGEEGIPSKEWGPTEGLTESGLESIANDVSLAFEE